MDDEPSIEKLLEEYRARNPHAPRPNAAPIDGHLVMAAHRLEVPEAGTVQLRCISKRDDVVMGVDLSVQDGGFALADGSTPSTLRTWWEASLDDTVTYRYTSGARFLGVTTAHRIPSGDSYFVDQWTGESGFWVEGVSDGDVAGHAVTVWRYHANHRDTVPRTYADLIFDVVLTD